jgi:hypothetical protein
MSPAIYSYGWYGWGGGYRGGYPYGGYPYWGASYWGPYWGATYWGPTYRPYRRGYPYHGRTGYPPNIPYRDPNAGNHNGSPWRNVEKMNPRDGRPMPRVTRPPVTPGTHPPATPGTQPVTPSPTFQTPPSPTPPATGSTATWRPRSSCQPTAMTSTPSLSSVRCARSALPSRAPQLP